MGFRSTVVIALDKSTIASQLLLGNPLPGLLANATPNHDCEEYRAWVFEEIKWYTTAFADVKETQDFIDNLPNEEDEKFGFYILHEDMTTDLQGDPSHYGIYIESRVITDFGDF